MIYHMPLVTPSEMLKEIDVVPNPKSFNYLLGGFLTLLHDRTSKSKKSWGWILSYFSHFMQYLGFGLADFAEIDYYIQFAKQ